MNYGTEAHKLVRAEGPDTSTEAANKVNTIALEEMVHNDITTFGDAGCISDDIRALHPGIPYSSITARYRALLDKGYIIDTGERRPGKSGAKQRVMKAV